MKIRFAIVTPGILAQVRAEVDMLRSAVDAGDMDGVDAVTATLLSLTTNCRSFDLTEEEWRVLLEGIRSRNPAFQSNYLLPGEVCADILPTVAANDFVLELPLDGETEKEVTGV
jgi:hypothetical protein